MATNQKAKDATRSAESRENARLLIATFMVATTVGVFAASNLHNITKNVSLFTLVADVTMSGTCAFLYLITTGLELNYFEWLTSWETRLVGYRKGFYNASIGIIAIGAPASALMYLCQFALKHAHAPWGYLVLALMSVGLYYIIRPGKRVAKPWGHLPQ